MPDAGDGARRLRGVLLDVDGTLVDSNEAHVGAWVDVLHAHGHEVTPAQVRPLIGMGGGLLVETLVGIPPDDPRSDALGSAHDERFQQAYLPTLAPTPGARALVERLRAEGLVLVVATSSREAPLAALLEQAGVADLLDCRTNADEVREAKPEPDIVCAALAKAGLAADAAVLVGDTPYDLEAARRAGVGFVGVRSGGWDGAAFAGALAVYDDPAALLREFDRSPLAR